MVGELKAQLKADEDARALAEKKAREAAIEARRQRRDERSSMSEAELFASAMAGVKPLTQDERGRAPAANPRRAVDAQLVTAEAEALAQLVELVAGTGPFDMSCTEEFIEGRVPGVDKRILVALKRGDYAVRAHLDLHGLTRAEAKPKIEAFLDESRRAGRRCVLLIHGRGLNSKDQLPVLKESLRSWLSQGGRIGKAVLAFCTARPCDGGAGALYLLLRR
ncbi:MAG: Smr/MutS family protein [Myxococcales bacterium]|nr:Smr/MutS family protein [Myxococcales bacterium]